MEVYGNNQKPTNFRLEIEKLKQYFVKRKDEIKAILIKGELPTEIELKYLAISRNLISYIKYLKKGPDEIDLNTLWEMYFKIIDEPTRSQLINVISTMETELKKFHKSLIKNRTYITYSDISKKNNKLVIKSFSEPLLPDLNDADLTSQPVSKSSSLPNMIIDHTTITSPFDLKRLNEEVQKLVEAITLLIQELSNPELIKRYGVYEGDFNSLRFRYDEKLITLVAAIIIKFIADLTYDQKMDDKIGKFYQAFPKQFPCLTKLGHVEGKNEGINTADMLTAMGADKSEIFAHSTKSSEDDLEVLSEEVLTATLEVTVDTTITEELSTLPEEIACHFGPKQ